MDSYINKVLTSGEKLLHAGQVSWWTLLGPLTLAAVLFVTAVSLAVFRPIPVVPLLLLGGSAITAIVAYIRQRSTEIAITGKRIIVKRGFVRRDTIEINLVKVESLQVEQNLLGRLLNFGDIVISAGGGPMAPVTGIANPLEFRKLFNQATDKAQQQAD